MDDILNINDINFDNVVSKIYHSEPIPLITKFRFLDLNLSIFNVIVSTKILILKLSIPILDGDVPRSTSYGVYISELIRFAKASSHVADFNTHNKLLTQKLLKEMLLS